MGPTFMETTNYFKTHVMRKRPYIKMEWLEMAAKDPLKQEVQPDGRIRCWIYVEEVGKYVRVVFMENGEVHNAFFDRCFKRG